MKLKDLLEDTLRLKSPSTRVMPTRRRHERPVGRTYSSSDDFGDDGYNYPPTEAELAQKADIEPRVYSYRGWSIDTRRIHFLARYVERGRDFDYHDFFKFINFLINELEDPDHGNIVDPRNKQKYWIYSRTYDRSMIAYINPSSRYIKLLTMYGKSSESFDRPNDPRITPMFIEAIGEGTIKRLDIC